MVPARNQAVEDSQPADAVGSPQSGTASGSGESPVRQLTAAGVVQLALFFSLLTGLIESLNWFTRRYLLDQNTFQGDLVFWLAPLAQVMVITIPTLVAVLVFAVTSKVFIRKLAVFGILAVCMVHAAQFLPIFGWARLLLGCGVAVQLTRLTFAFPRAVVRGARRGVPLLAVIVVVIAFVVATGPSRREREMLAQLPPAAPGAPNVILIVLDTVFADALSLHGAEGSPSPHLDAIAAEGVIFDRAYSTAPWTAPSHISMFTGEYRHRQSPDLFTRPWKDDYPTLAERLHEAGYLTAGFVANVFYCSRLVGLDRGFAHYEDHVLTAGAVATSNRILERIMKSRIPLWLGYYNKPDRKSAREVNTAFLSWLSHQSGRPYFAFLNYFDVHDPYVAPPGYRSRPMSFQERKLIKTWWYTDKEKLTPEQVRLGREAYTDCLRYLDAQIGELYGELQRRGELENTIVIVTSDHGEHFGEHGLFGHANSLYEPLVHVPCFIVAPPGRLPAARRIKATVSMRDVAATVCELVGLGTDHPFPGRSLSRYWEGSGEASADNEGDLALCEVAGISPAPANHGHSPAATGPMKSLVVGSMKYIRNGDGQEQLFDLDQDPHEQHDLARQEAFQAELQRLRDRLDDLLAP